MVGESRVSPFLVSRKTVLTMVSLLIIGVFVGAAYVSAYTSSDYYLNSPMSGFRTIIETDGVGEYRCLSGLTGAIISSGASARVVFEAAIDLGGRVLIRAGTYQLTPTAVADGFVGVDVDVAGTVIVGEGASTLINLYDCVDARVFHVTALNVEIRDMKLDGKGLNIAPDASDALIAFGVGASYGKVENVVVVNGFDSDGMGCYRCAGVQFVNCYVENCEHGYAVTYSDNCKITNSFAINNDGVGFLIHQPSFDNVIASCYSSTNHQDGFQIAEEVGTAGVPQRNTIVGCVAVGNSWSGISLCSTSYNIISGCESVQNVGSGMQIGNASGGASLYNIVDGCVFNGGTQLNGYVEIDSTDYTVLTNCVAVSNTVVQLKTLGANSKCSDCYNGTSWLS